MRSHLTDASVYKSSNVKTTSITPSGQSYQCDPYGNVTNSTGSIDNPYQYASGYTDSATGLIQFGLRYYQPATGRWTQQDPLGGSLFDPSSGNRYAYANANPVNLVDPTGADTIWGACLKQALIWGTAGVIGGAVAGSFGGGVGALPGAGIGLLGGLGGGCAAGAVTVIGHDTGLWNFFNANNS